MVSRCSRKTVFLPLGLLLLVALRRPIEAFKQPHSEMTGRTGNLWEQVLVRVGVVVALHSVVKAYRRDQ